MDDFGVDIKFPRNESDNPNLVAITGGEDQVIECSEYLYNQEAEFVSILWSLWFRFLTFTYL